MMTARLQRFGLPTVCALALAGMAATAFAANPPWYKAGTQTGFPPHVSDFFQHQKLEPAAGGPSAPPGQSAATWENLGGWCNRATYANACYRLYKEGSTLMFGTPDPVIVNDNWLTHANDYISNLAGSMSGNDAKWQKWLDDHADIANPRPLKYDYVVYFPDAWFNSFTPAPPAAGGLHYLGIEVDRFVFPPVERRAWKPLPGTIYDKLVRELKDGATVMLVLRTMPWVPELVFTDPPANTKGRWKGVGFDSSIWWQGNGGNADVIGTYPPTWGNPPKTFAPSWGTFHSVQVAGINEAQRRVYFADPDSNKGNLVTNAGFDRNDVQQRKYHPWIAELGGGDAIPVPPRGAAPEDPPLFHSAYYIGVTIDDNTVPAEFRGRRINPADAGNERYRNVVINMLELINVKRLRPRPLIVPLAGDPPPPTPTPTLCHEFEAESGPVNAVDELWIFAMKDIATMSPPLGQLAGWQVQYIDPPATQFDPPVLDPFGNPITTRGVRLYAGAQPPLSPGQLGELNFCTTEPWDGKDYELFTRDADNPSLYSVQSYGGPEAEFGDQVLPDTTEIECDGCGGDGDLNGDGDVNADDLIDAITKPGSTTIISDVTNVLKRWRPAP